MKFHKKYYLDYIVLSIIVSVSVLLSIFIVKKGFYIEDPLTPKINAGEQISDIYTQILRELNGKYKRYNVVVVSYSNNYSRSDLAILIDSLNSMSPKAIGLDMGFSTTQAEDSLLINSIQRCPNIVLPAVAHYNKDLETFDYDRTEYVCFSESLHNKSFGSVNLSMHSLQFIERYFKPFFPTSNGDTLNSLAAELVKLYSPEKFEVLKQRNESFEYVNYHHDVEFNIIDWKDVISANTIKQEIRERISGKIVLIGTLANNIDKHIIPLHIEYSGVMIHASIIDTILQEDYISSACPSLSYIIAVVICVIFVSLFYIARKSWTNMGNVLVRIGQILIILIIFFIGLLLYKYSIYIDVSTAAIAIGISAICFDIIYGTYGWIKSF